MSLPTDICNGALLRLGQPRVNSIEPPFTDGADGLAAACAFAYPKVRDAELRKHVWSFAKARKIIPADGSTPVFTDGCAVNQYRKPADFLRLIKTRDARRTIEGEFILSSEGSPLKLHYICRPNPALFDPLFVEALSCAVAIRLTVRVTTSSAEKQRIEADYKSAIDEAVRINAIEQPVEFPPEDIFITARR